MLVVAVLTCVAIVSVTTVFVVYNPFQAQVLASDKSSSVFDAELTYAFTGRTNATGEGHDHFGWGIQTYPTDYYPVTAILNLTYRGNPENKDYDLICEGYMVNFTADTGAFVSVLGWLGTNYNASSKFPTMTFRDSPWGHISSMYFKFNMSTGDISFLRATDGGTFSSVNGTLGLWSNGTPNMVIVTLQRAGWLTFRGNETSSVINPDVNTVIQQITLQKIGEDLGFGTYPSGRVY